MRTLEVRSYLGGTTECILWNRTPTQVRDALYPGVAMVEQVKAMTSNSPAIAVFCKAWKLEDAAPATLPTGTYVSLIEIPG